MRKALFAAWILLALVLVIGWHQRAHVPRIRTPSNDSGIWPSQVMRDGETPSDAVPTNSTDSPVAAQPGHDPDSESLPSPASPLRDLVTHLDLVCENGGDIVDTIIAVERQADAVRGLSGPEDLALLRGLHNREAQALFLLALARIDRERLVSVVPEFLGSQSAKVRIACYWGLVIDPIAEGLTSAGREKLWQGVWGGLQFLSQASIETQRNFISHVCSTEDPQRVRLMVSGMKSPDASTRNICALLLMASRADQAATQAYREALGHDESPVVQESAARALAGDTSAESRECLRTAIVSQSSEEVRIQSIRSLGMSADAEDTAFLMDRFHATQSEDEQSAVVIGLAHSRSPAVFEFLTSVLRGDSDVSVKSDALDALAERTHDALATREVIGALTSGDDWIRMVAAKSLGKMGDPAAIAPLECLVEADPSESVREHARDALRQLRK